MKPTYYSQKVTKNMMKDTVEWWQ